MTEMLIGVSWAEAPAPTIQVLVDSERVFEVPFAKSCFVFPVPPNKSGGPDISRNPIVLEESTWKAFVP